MQIINSELLRSCNSDDISRVRGDVDTPGFHFTDHLIGHHVKQEISYRPCINLAFYQSQTACKQAWVWECKLVNPSSHKSKSFRMIEITGIVVTKKVTASLSSTNLTFNLISKQEIKKTSMQRTYSHMVQRGFLTLPLRKVQWSMEAHSYSIESA